MNEEKTQIVDGVASVLNAELGLCQCKSWAAIGNDTFKHLILTGHHKTCPNSRRISNADYEKLLSDLIVGIERWADSEDGIPDFIGNAYTKAKVVIKT